MRRGAFRLRAFALVSLVLAVAAGWSDSAAEEPDPAARESAVLAFVAEHQPKLAVLLERLKPMNQDEYEKAITELHREFTGLEAVRTRDPRRYELGLAAWKARTCVELLSAQLAGRSGPGPDPDLESPLRAALAAQVDVEIERWQHDRQQAEARAQRAREAAERLERERGRIVEQRFRDLSRKGQAARPRNRETGAKRPASPAASARAAGETPR